MVPNHIMQLISLTAMEPPISFQADAVRDEQAKVLHAIQPFSSEEVLQQDRARPIRRGRDELRNVCPVTAQSRMSHPTLRTETFVAMKINIDNWRWAGVPFYVRTGKHLPSRNTHIVIQFRRAPFVLFRDTASRQADAEPVGAPYPARRRHLSAFRCEDAGPVMRLGTVDMDFEYADYFGEQPSTGYERLLHDCMIGDATLFQRADMVEAGWSVVSPLLDVWKALPPRNFPNYAAGAWGPKDADELMEKDGRRWRNFDK